MNWMNQAVVVEVLHDQFAPGDLNESGKRMGTYITIWYNIIWMMDVFVASCDARVRVVFHVCITVLVLLSGECGPGA